MIPSNSVAKLSRFFRVGEAAERLGVSSQTLKQWIYKGTLRTVQTAGGHHRISPAEVDRLLARGSSDTPAPSRRHRPIAPVLVALSGQYTMLVALLTVSGLGISVFKTGALALIGDITPSNTAHTRLMNNVEGLFAVGAIVGPAVVAVLLARGLSWKWLYLFAAAICAGLVIMAARARYPATRTAVQRPDLRQMLRVMRDPAAVGFSLLVMLYVAAEVAIYVWMPTWLQSYTGSWGWLAASALTLFFVLRALGRFLGAWLLERASWTAARIW